MSEQVSRRFIIADGKFPEQPVRINRFDTDNDVLVVDHLGLTRADLTFSQNGADVLMKASSGEELAMITNMNAVDFDPLPLVKNFYKSWSENDPEKVLESLSENVTLEAPGPTDQMPWAGKRTGHAGVREYFDLFQKGIIAENLEPVHLIVQGNIVVAVLQGSGRSQRGVVYNGGVVHWMYIRNGKIDHLQQYYDTFPVVEALNGGRPFSVPAQAHSHYVVQPLSGIRNTDSVVFDSSVFETSPATVQSVKRMYGALQGLNVPEVRAVFAPDVTWHMLGPEDLLIWAGERNGPDEAVDSAREIIDTMNFDHFRAVQMICQGNTAAVTIEEPGNSKATGLPFKTSVVHIVVTNDEGKIASFKNYINTALIVEAFSGGRPYSIT